jgi:hypothetical protein
MSDRRRNVRVMGNKPVDPAPYAEALRAADPRLREPLAGPLARSQPSVLDALREARFAAYRRRADVRPPAQLPERPRTRRDAAAAQAWNTRFAAYRVRLGEIQVPEPAAAAAGAAEISRNGAAAARAALRRCRQEPAA